MVQKISFLTVHMPDFFSPFLEVYSYWSTTNWLNQASLPLSSLSDNWNIGLSLQLLHLPNIQSNFIKPFSKFSHSQPLEKYFVLDFSIFCLSISKLFKSLKHRHKFKQNLHRQLSFLFQLASAHEKVSG